MAFVRASCKCCFPGKATLPAAREKGSFVIRLRPQGCSRNPNVRRYRREITLGKWDSTVVTGHRFTCRLRQRPPGYGFLMETQTWTQGETCLDF